MKMADVDIANHDAYVDAFPYGMFDVLRREDPVHWTEDRFEGVPFWAFTKHEDIIHASRHPEIYSSFARTSIFREPTMENELEEQQLMLVNLDPPDHTRLRSIVNSGFTPRMIARLEDHIREYATVIVDRALEQGEGDFVRLVSAELPLEIIAELMGAPLDDRQFIFDLSNRLIGFDDPEFQTSPEDARIAATEMFVYAENLRQEREKNPQDDIITKLAQAEVDGHRLNEMEFDLFFILLAVAGNETTRNAITHGMAAFIDHPDQWARLRDDRSLLDTAADEIVRWAHPVIQFRRTAMRDDEVRGKTIHEGDKVVLWYASGNRDEDVFEDPYKFDIGRDPNPHIGFGGGGPHFCLGSHLAKLEIKVMFDVLADRMPHVQPAGEPRRLRSHFINGIKEMPVTFA